MIRVTDSASETLYWTIVATGIETGKTLRLHEDDACFRLEIDAPGFNDRVVRHRGRAVLLVDRGLEDRMTDAVIDVEGRAEDPQLVVYVKRREADRWN